MFRQSIASSKKSALDAWRLSGRKHRAGPFRRSEIPVPKILLERFRCGLGPVSLQLPFWKTRPLQADMLISQKYEFNEAKWIFLKIPDGRRDWSSAAFRIVRSTSNFGRSRGMRPSLRQPGK